MDELKAFITSDRKMDATIKQCLLQIVDLMGTGIGQPGPQGIQGPTGPAGPPWW